ncbi:MAG: hypothetical protein K2I66_02350, partial [Bacteroidales bacterium]|nr:hypothetical protein [Bacteroidales bacterium]
MMKAAGKFLFYVVLAAVSVSCIHPEDFDMDRLASDSVRYDIAMPLVDARLTIENLIAPMGGLFVPDENGLLHLVYTTEAYEQNLIKNFTLGDHYIGIGESGVPYNRLDTLLVFTSRDSVAIETRNLPAGTEIKKLYLNSVRLSFTVANRFMDPLDLKIRFPNVKELSGAEISVQRRIEGGQTEDIVVDYPELYIEMEGSEPYVLRESEVQVDMRGMTQDSAQYWGGYSVQGTLGNMLFSRLEGYMGKVNFSFGGELPITGLGLERMKDVNLNAATINTDFLLNGVSAPVRLAKSVIEVHNQAGPQELEVFEPDYALPYPAIDKVPMQEETLTKTDVKDVLVDRPTHISFWMLGSLNPNDERDQLQAFEQNSFIRMSLACDVPAWFSADNYTLYDTVAISFADKDTEINYLEIKTIFKNAFPLDFNVDLIFLNRNYSPVLALFEDRLVESAAVGPEPALHVTTPTVQNFYDELTDEQVAAIRSASYAVIRAKVNSYQKGDVKIYMPSENEGFFNAKVGFRAKVT